METAKLTLRPGKAIIELAHQMAKEENTSVTRMFSAFILARHQRKMSSRKIPVGPLTLSVAGTLHVPEGWDYKKDMEDILDGKYGKNENIH